VTAIPAAKAIENLPCGCSEEEMAFCLRWIAEHGAPCEWDAAAEGEYKRALDRLREQVAA